MDGTNFKPQKLDGFEPTEDEDDQCAAARAGLPKRKTFNFTLRQEVCLDTVREILSMYMNADARHWHAALEFTEMHLGEAVSASFVAHVTNLLRALRLERSCPFNYLTFGCKHITSDELAMMSALRTACLGPGYEYEDALSYLAQSGRYAKLDRAVMALAGLLGDPDGEGASAERRDGVQDAFRRPSSKLH